MNPPELRKNADTEDFTVMMNSSSSESKLEICPGMASKLGVAGLGLTDIHLIIIKL